LLGPFVIAIISFLFFSLIHKIRASKWPSLILILGFINALIIFFLIIILYYAYPFINVAILGSKSSIDSHLIFENFYMYSSLVGSFLTALVWNYMQLKKKYLVKDKASE